MRKKLIYTLVASAMLPLAGYAGHLPGSAGLKKTASPIPEGMCRIILEAHDVFGTGTDGFQWILDSKHATFGNTFFEGYMFFGDYAGFDYKLPVDAEASLATDKTVVDGVEELTIPAGVYDWMTIHPGEEGLMYAYGDYALVDDFTMLEGKTYRMLVEYGDGDKGPGAYVNLIVDTDLAMAELNIPVSGVGLTDSEEISVRIVNQGVEDMQGVKVSYSVNNGEAVTEEIPDAIKAGENIVYTFSKKADFSALGNYEVSARLEVEGDMLDANNMRVKKCRHLEKHELPYNCDFSQLDYESFENEWINIDADGDGMGWMYNEYYTNKQGDLGVASCSGNFMGSMKNDDWLISQPLDMKTGTNNVAFSVRSLDDLSTELMEVCIGSTPEPENMKKVASFEICSIDWLVKAANFDIESDGVYYVALHSVSQNGKNQFVGDVTVSSGEFVGAPFVKISKAILPVSNACLPSESRIGVSIINTGTAPLANYTLTAYVNDKQYVKTFTDEILPDTSADLYIDELIDFSAVGKYEIQFLVQSEAVDETLSKEIECYESLDLPIVTNFSNDVNSGIWHSLGENAWFYESMFHSFGSEAHGLENGLLCCGFNLNGPMRMKMSYRAGGYDSTGLGIYFGKAGSDISTYKRVFYDESVTSDAEEIEFTVSVDEPGCYSVIIVDECDDKYNPSFLRLNEVMISEVKSHDIRISNVDSFVSPYIPASQISGEGAYTVNVENRGLESMTGVKLTAYVDGVEFKTLDTPFDIAPGESESCQLVFSLPDKASGESISISFAVEGNEEDGNMDDNSYVLPTITVTDDTRACENIESPVYGTGATGMTIALGNVYTFIKDADLTAVTIGLSQLEPDDENLIGNITLNIYRLNADMSIDRKIYSETMERGYGGMVTLDIPDMRLAAGSYCFEVEQLSIYNMGLAYDPDNVGVCYLHEGEDLIKTDYYPLCIRAIFGGDPKVYASDAAARRFSSPTYTNGLFSSEEVVSAIVRNAGYEEADINVALSVDGVMFAEKRVSLKSYEESEVSFEGVNLSEPGIHALKVEAKADGDENESNDVNILEIEAAEEQNPYFMDFESCNDFDAAGDPFNPRWTTFDRNEVKTTYFWRYDHANRGEACGFMAFNPGATIPSMIEEGFEGMYAHSGERFGLAFSFNPYEEGGQELTESDVWIISPKLKLGSNSEFELYVKTRYLESPDQDLEPYRLLVSDSENTPECFKVIGDDVRIAPMEDWELVTADLSEYDGKEVYVAVQYIGKPVVNTCLMIDDLYVKTNTTGMTHLADGQKVVVKGNSIIAPEGSRVFTVSGIETGATNLPAGIYIVRTPAYACKVVVR